jgi:hypothetical protein
MASRPVTVRILHPEPGPTSGPIERWVAMARAELAERHRRAFVRAGAADVAVIGGPPDDTPFGARLRAIVRADHPAGLVVLGSGAIPLAARRDYADLVAAAGRDARQALANNRYSADVVAIAHAEDLATDNALPRWLDEAAGFTVADLRRRWRLAIDVDGPLELVLLGRTDAPAGTDLGPLRDRLAAVQGVAGDRRAEFLVAGRASASTVTWLEGRVPARVRALVEERGLRTRTGGQRPPASVLGMVLDQVGPAGIGAVLGRLGEAALVDTRVLLAHRLGPDEAAWPPPADRFASDLLLADQVRDPWLRDLTTAALGAPVPVVLGGHSLVGPGVRLWLDRGAIGRRPWS